MFFRRGENPQQMTDEELRARGKVLDSGLAKTGKGVTALKLWNAVIIMGGVLGLGLISGFTLGTAAAGLVIGVIAMASVRTTAEILSKKLHTSRICEKADLLEEEKRRLVAAIEQQRLDQLAAPEKKKELVRSIEKDFNEGLSGPVKVRGTLTLKKLGVTMQFTAS